VPVKSYHKTKHCTPGEHKLHAVIILGLPRHPPRAYLAGGGGQEGHAPNDHTLIRGKQITTLYVHVILVGLVTVRNERNTAKTMMTKVIRILGKTLLLIGHQVGHLQSKILRVHVDWPGQCSLRDESISSYRGCWIEILK